MSETYYIYGEYLGELKINKNEIIMVRNIFTFQPFDFYRLLLWMELPTPKPEIVLYYSDKTLKCSCGVGDNNTPIIIFELYRSRVYVCGRALRPSSARKMSLIMRNIHEGD
jgi:hypothetical protein